MIKPAVDYVLDPVRRWLQLPLGTIPFTGHVVYLNSFLPSGFHNVKTIFFFTLLMIFGIKAHRRISGLDANPVRRPRRRHQSA